MSRPYIELGYGNENLCPGLPMNLAIASSAVGTWPNTSRWSLGSAPYRPLWNQRIIAARFLDHGVVAGFWLFGFPYELGR